MKTGNFHLWSLRKTPKINFGFTLIEVMVVIVIMGILAGVAVPKVFGLIERSRERLDLVRLWYIKNAVERNLIGHDYGIFTSISAGTATVICNNNCSLGTYLTNKSGMSLFGVDVDKTTLMYRKGSANSDDSYTSGFLSDVMKESGFEALAQCLLGNGGTGGLRSCNSQKPFESKSLNKKKSEGGIAATNGTFSVKIKWLNTENVKENGTNVSKPTSQDVIVWIGGDWNGAERGAYGTCFSTLGDSACK